MTDKQLIHELDHVPAEKVRLFIQQLIVMGFDLDRNSAIDLIEAILQMNDITKGGEVN